MASTHEGFLRHARLRWLRAAVALVLLCLVPYLWHDPVDGPNGGTWLGYTLGTIGALLILWLTWLGVRKRRYRSRLGTVRGWLSAHVYLGLSLLVVATLHTGFQFGWNLHTLAYALMVLVIASGLYGVVAYARYPAAITRHRSEETREAWLQEILDLNEQALRHADALGPEIHRVILRSTERMQLGGNFWRQLFPRAPRTIEGLDAVQREATRTPAASTATMELPATSTVMFLASRITRAAGDLSEAERARQLLDVLGRRNALVERLNQDVALHARMQVWLYLHVPLTCALLAALTAHILAVFIYW